MLSWEETHQEGKKAYKKIQDNLEFKLWEYI